MMITEVRIVLSEGKAVAIMFYRRRKLSCHVLPLTNIYREFRLKRMLDTCFDVLWNEDNYIVLGRKVK